MGFRGNKYAADGNSPGSYRALPIKTFQNIYSDLSSSTSYWLHSFEHNGHLLR